MNRLVRTIIVAFMAANSLFLASAMNGKSVLVIQRQTNPDWANQRTSNLVIATIINNRVTASDTILRSSIGAEMVAPRFSFDGKKIAFARTVGGGVSLSLIDIDGKNLHDIATYDMSKAEGRVINNMTRPWINLDWPRGDWIYYFCGGSGAEVTGKSATIRRISASDPTKNEVITTWACDVARFSLSANAKYSAVDIYRSTVFSANGPRLGTFPPPDPSNPNSGTVISSNYCNSAISPSGTIMFHFSGAHNKIDFAFWTLTLIKVSPASAHKNTPSDLFLFHRSDLI